MEQQTSHDKPIPAFYCCYLLRSTVRHASLYIGSTPNPARRLPQHNGTAKGGAHRTAREKLRPWEMVVIVEGFTSRIAALQFEWAWQHAGDSRHVKPDEESSGHVVINPKSGKARPRARGSARSLTAHLSNLHRLLRSAYFSSWPLKVRFFCADVYRVWNLWNERVDGPIPDNIRVIRDGNCGPPNDSSGDDCVGSAQNIKADYSKIRDYLEKANFVLEDSERRRCKVCEAQVMPMEEPVLVCPQMNCHCIAHLLCLSERFLNATENPDQLVPTHGICPACKETVHWPLMMQELTLRCRGEKELRSILRKKKKDNKSSEDGLTEMHTDCVDEADSLVRNLPTVDPVQKSCFPTVEKQRDRDDRDLSPLDEDWLEALEFGSDSDADGRLTTQPKHNPSRIEIVIEDSDEAD